MPHKRWSGQARGITAAVSAFIIGMAFHSVFLHEKACHSWRFLWNHDEEDENEEG